VSELGTDKKFALKIYEISKNSSEELMGNLMNEIHLLESLNHPNIIKMKEWFVGKYFIYLVLEYVGPVSLLDYLEQLPENCMTEEEVAHVFYEVAKALSYLHGLHIAHQDVKLNNILLGIQGEVRLIDFGFSQKLKENQKITKFCGTPSYMAPEILSRMPHLADKGDVWSFGVCLYRTLTGKFPFRGTFASPQESTKKTCST